MSQEILLPYGTSPYVARLPPTARVVWPPNAPAPRPLDLVLEEALDDPVAMPRLEELCPRSGRATVIVSDDTRHEPRRAFVRAVVRRLPTTCRLAIAVASGRHGPRHPSELDLGEDVVGRAELIAHDADRDSELVSLGTTSRGTPVRINRALVKSDVVVATGTIRPHYFAGFGGGAKAVFPGLAGRRDIDTNHELKREPGARAGVIDSNPCRLDLEEAAGLMPGQLFLLNAVADAAGGLQAAVAGDVRAAFRVGAAKCEPLFTVRAPRSGLVVVSDGLPLTSSLYQASKLAAAGACLVEDGGTLAVVAQCPDGTGPLETVNRGIYEIGIAPRLPDDHRIILISDLDAGALAGSYCEFAESLEAVVAEVGAVPTVLPRAGSLMVVPEG